jgi:hypothetical protein
VKEEPVVIEGRVAQILNHRELIINRGRNDGVAHGMTFEILIGEPLQVNDPETGESLGILERTKASVRASEVHDKFAVCQRRQRIARRESRVAPEGFFAPKSRGSPTVADETNVDLLSEEEQEIKVGDRVKQTSQTETIPFSARPQI